MLKIRSRFGAYLIEKKYVLSESYKRKPLPRVIALVADQTMFGERSLYWLDFLNQSTPFINGPERISKILNLPVVYGIMRRVKRGYYETEFVYIEKDPEHSLPNQVTEKFASVLEKTILASPSSWLWSHNRWKNKKPDTPVA
jgi:KDO2-lipid IV(A) lauroyltransferase